MRSRPCPPGKMLNPDSNRCVLIDGKIGRKIAKKQKEEEDSLKRFSCPENKVYRIQTDRCVEINGLIGERVMKQALEALPFLKDLPSELAFQILRSLKTKPRNCGHLLSEMRMYEPQATANKETLRKSVGKTIDRMERILTSSYYLKEATLRMGSNDISLMEECRRLRKKTKTSGTIESLMDCCRQVVTIKTHAKAIMNQLREIQNHVESYIKTGKIPRRVMGNLVLYSYPHLEQVRLLDPKNNIDLNMIQLMSRTFKKRLLKDERALDQLTKPLETRV